MITWSITLGNHITPSAEEWNGRMGKDNTVEGVNIIYATCPK